MIKKSIVSLSQQKVIRIRVFKEFIDIPIKKTPRKDVFFMGYY